MLIAGIHTGVLIFIEEVEILVNNIPPFFFSRLCSIATYYKEQQRGYSVTPLFINMLMTPEKCQCGSFFEKNNNELLGCVAPFREKTSSNLA